MELVIPETPPGRAIPETEEEGVQGVKVRVISTPAAPAHFNTLPSSNILAAAAGPAAAAVVVTQATLARLAVLDLLALLLRR